MSNAQTIGSESKMENMIAAAVAKNPSKLVYWFALWYGFTGQPLNKLGFTSELAVKGYRIGQRLAALGGPEA